MNSILARMDNMSSRRCEPTDTPLSITAGDGMLLAATYSGGSNQSVLLAHGFGQTRQSWSATQAKLSGDGYASLAFDMRGHGKSGRNPGHSAYTADQFIGDHVAAAAALGQSPVLVGASMGGLTGLLAQAEHGLFSALVLVDVTPRWETAGARRIHDFMTAHPEGFDSFEHASQVIAEYLPHRRQRKTPAQLEHLLRPNQHARLQWHWDPRLLSEFIAGSEQFQDVVSAAAGKVDVPVLLISGGRSDLVSDETVAHFQELVPQARHVRLPEASHMVAGDDNDAFTDSLLGFLRAQFPSSNPAPEPAVTRAPVNGSTLSERTSPGAPR